MKKKVSKPIVCILTFLIIFSNTNFCFALDLTQENLETLENFLTKGIETANNISAFESDSQIELSDIVTEIEFNAQAKEDTEEFISTYLNSNSRYLRCKARSSDTEVNEAKASAIAYAIKCAHWSYSNGRTNDIPRESEYMFISHYIDRNDYFWNQGNPELLLDGEITSEYVSGGALAKWLTESDRQAYRNYMRATLTAKTLNRIRIIAESFFPLRIISCYYNRLQTI